MKNIRSETLVRGGIVLAILLAGLAMIPFVDLPATALGWELFAGVYSPKLEVNEKVGAPGSIFTFTGSDYPPNSRAVIYANGLPIGAVNTDGSGKAAFLLDTKGAAVGVYNITMEVDVNASATESIELIASEPLVPPPSDFPGPTIVLTKVIYMPTIGKNE